MTYRQKRAFQLLFLSLFLLRESLCSLLRLPIGALSLAHILSLMHSSRIFQIRCYSGLSAADYRADLLLLLSREIRIVCHHRGAKYSWRVCQKIWVSTAKRTITAAYCLKSLHESDTTSFLMMPEKKWDGDAVSVPFLLGRASPLSQRRNIPLRTCFFLSSYLDRVTLITSAYLVEKGKLKITTNKCRKDIIFCEILYALIAR